MIRDTYSSFMCLTYLSLSSLFGGKLSACTQKQLASMLFTTALCHFHWILVYKISRISLHVANRHKEREYLQARPVHSIIFYIPPTLGDLTQIFPTFSNLILNLSFYTKADPKSTYMSNIQQNSVELWTNLRFCNHAPIS